MHESGSGVVNQPGILQVYGLEGDIGHDDGAGTKYHIMPRDVW